jgi:uncharacterized membrane protein YcjF (UPF0283 family)
VTDTVTLDPPRPRIETEAVPAPRLEPDMPVLAIAGTPDHAVGTIPLVAGGAGVLCLGLAALGTVNFVLDQFVRSPLLGGLTAAVGLIGFGLILAGIWRELRGLLAVESVDRLRAALTGPDALAARPALRRWLARLPEGAPLAEAAAVVDEPEALRALLRAGPVAELRGKADALGRAAAVQAFAATAAIPSPAFDALIVAWRGTRLVRQVAELHGLRPGLLGTLALLRRTLLSAASVAALDLAANTLSRALLSNPLLAHVTGDVAGAGLAARRMIILARVASLACTPLPPDEIV